MLHMQLARLNRVIFGQPCTGLSLFILMYYQFIRSYMCKSVILVD